MGSELASRTEELHDHNAVANCGIVCRFEHIQIIGVHAGGDVGAECHGVPEHLSGRSLLSSFQDEPLNDQFKELALHTGIALTANPVSYTHLTLPTIYSV